MCGDAEKDKENEQKNNDHNGNIIQKFLPYTNTQPMEHTYDEHIRRRELLPIRRRPPNLRSRNGRHLVAGERWLASGTRAAARGEAKIRNFRNRSEPICIHCGVK